MPRSTGCLIALAFFCGCATPFKYTTHQKPRISVIHRPLHPTPGDPVSIIARAEPAPGTVVQEIRISLVREVGDPEEKICNDGENECTLNAPAVGAVAVGLYGAEMTDSSGEKSYPPSSYFFQTGQPPGKEAFPLRVPFSFGRAYRVVLVRDKDSYPNDSQLLADADVFVNDQILPDMAYRWRDNQLSLWYTTIPGVTKDYYSGLTARCGQDPWPGQGIPPSLMFADSFGVIHRNDDYRDCAGLGFADGANPSRNFSGHGQRPAVVQHEMGHALFGLGDEYFEDEASRQAPGGEGPANPWTCIPCCDEGNGGGGVDDPGVTPGLPEPRPVPAPVVPVICRPEQPPCGEPLPPECFAAPPMCPTIASSCWKPNIFASQAACQGEVPPINAHPGVELTADAGRCRAICQGNCPCVGPLLQPLAEVWKVDDREPLDPAQPGEGDIMEDTTPPDSPTFHGPACQRCMETSLCVLWETARLNSQEQALANCMEPQP